ncbi:hypothetical protein C8J56DRAFT_1033064, partial [Mycena floridula]
MSEGVYYSSRFIACYILRIRALSLFVPQLMFVGQPCYGNWTRADSDPSTFFVQARQTDNQGGKSLFSPFTLPPITSAGKSEGTAFSLPSCPELMVGQWIIEAFKDDPNSNSTSLNSGDPHSELTISNIFEIKDSGSDGGDTPTSSVTVPGGQTPSPTSNDASISTALTESSVSIQITVGSTPTASASATISILFPSIQPNSSPFGPGSV